MALRQASHHISPQESRLFRNHTLGLPPGDHLLDCNHYDLEESRQCLEASSLEKKEELQQNYIMYGIIYNKRTHVIKIAAIITSTLISNYEKAPYVLYLTQY